MNNRVNEELIEALGLSDLDLSIQQYITSKYNTINGLPIKKLSELYELKLNLEYEYRFKQNQREEEMVNDYVPLEHIEEKTKHQLFDNLIYEIQEEIYKKSIENIGNVQFIKFVGK